jgi:hypothetical protein
MSRDVAETYVPQHAAEVGAPDWKAFKPHFAETIRELLDLLGPDACAAVDPLQVLGVHHLPRAADPAKGFGQCRGAAYCEAHQ